MGQTINITAADGHQLSAYEAKPEGSPRGRLVIIQELFGVNSHMRNVADQFAADGFHCLVPALFDRFERGFETGYTPDDMVRAREARGKFDFDNALLDVAAAHNALSGEGKVGVVGYCIGGTIAWLSAARIDGFSCAVLYYSGGIGAFTEEEPKCPVLCHYGEKDASIPLDDVEKLRTAQAGRPVEIFLYPAGHGFNCDQRGSYDAEASKLARGRTVEFLQKHL